jgi:MFS superfamily sulfate permease-like transporter
MDTLINPTDFNSSLETNSTSAGINYDEKLMEIKLKIATSLSFWCGIVQILFAVFKFGAVTKYFSQPLLRAFTTGASFHILVAQIPHVFGIYKSRSSTTRFFKLVMVTNIFFH